MRSPLRLSSNSPGELVTALSLIVLAGCGGGDGIVLPGEGEPAAIAVVDGDGQQGLVGEPLRDPLVVKVTDSRGRPVAGATVGFEFGSAGPGAAVVPQQKTTNGDGLADARLVLGTSIGRQTGQARVVLEEGREPIQAPFSAMALPENASSMTAVAGQDQTGHVGLPLDDRLVVEVTDGFGNPVPGVPINWVAEGGGTVGAAMVETDEDGRSRVDRTLGPTVGLQTTVASSEGLVGSPVTFVHTALAGDASRLVVLSGNDQTAEAGSLLPGELVVQLIDADGNGVPQTAVSWVVATGGGAPAPENSTTDGDGRTSARWTLGGTLGQQRLDAVVSGVGVATFRAIAVPVAPPSLFIRTQPSASARTGVPFARQPVVQLRDPQGNDLALAGVQVTAAIGSGGGELGGTRQVSTDASGQATFTNLSISGSPGSRTLVFNATGYAQATSSEVEILAAPNEAPDADYNWHCEGLTCQFTDASEDDDGDVVSWSWTFAGTGSSNLQNPSHTFPGPGEYEVTLRVTDNGGASDESSAGVEVDTPPRPNQSPTAEFTWECDDLECDFEDESRDSDGRIVDHDWTFDDGGTSDDDNPDHRYSAGGTYQVTLTVTDNDDAENSVTHPVTVTAPAPNQAPTAAFTADCDDLECKFESQSRDDDGRIEDYDWTFGDGGTSDDDDPDHRYSVAGTYQVTLTVTDNDDAENSVTHPVTVTAPPPPNQDPIAAFTQSCVNLTCSFNSGGSRDPDGTIVRRSWNFGDDNTSSEANPTHTYNEGDTYNVTLEVEDDDGETDDETHQVTVTAPPPPNQPPTAAFSPPSCTTGQACQFSDAGSGDSDGSIEGWAWTFGDPDSPDNTSASENPSHIYSVAGTYTVALTVTDDDGDTGQASESVTVNDPLPPAPGSLGFRTQPPSRTRSGERLDDAPEVELLSSSGEEAQLENVPVSVDIASGIASLSGTTTRETDDDGRAKFDDLAIIGSTDLSVVLVFTAPGFGSVDSQPILIEEPGDNADD